MALYREKAEAILIKIETTSGVDSVPTGANMVRSKGVPEVVVDYMDVGDRGDVQTGILSAADDAVPVGRYLRFDITVEIKGPASAYSATVRPEVDALLRMSGFSSLITTTAGSESAFYTTLDGGMETGTVYAFAAGKRFKALGCVAQPKLSAELYKPGTMTFTVTGKLAADPDEQALPTLSPQLVVPPSFHSALASLVGFTWTFLSSDATNPFMLLAASIDMGTTVADIGSAGATDGLAAWLVTDRNATQDLTFYAPLLSAFDPFAASKADPNTGTMFVTTFSIGTVQYNRVKIETRWRPRAPKLGNRNGAKTYSISGPLRAGSGISSGREIQLTFT